MAQEQAALSSSRAFSIAQDGWRVSKLFQKASLVKPLVAASVIAAMAFLVKTRADGRLSCEASRYPSARLP